MSIRLSRSSRASDALHMQVYIDLYSIDQACSTGTQQAWIELIIDAVLYVYLLLVCLLSLQYDTAWGRGTIGIDTGAWHITYNPHIIY
jgi:hypothetical protein